MIGPISESSSVLMTLDKRTSLKSVELTTFSTLTTIQCGNDATPLLLKSFIFIKSLFSKIWSTITAFFHWILGSRRTDAEFWKRAKKEFRDIHADTCLLKTGPNLKTYSKNVKMLSEDVKEGYKQHLLAAHAATVYSGKSASEQQEWVNTNISTFKFDAYFEMDKSNQVIVTAVTSYWQEIEANQPKK